MADGWCVRPLSLAAAAAAPFLEPRGEMAIKNNLRRKREGRGRERKTKVDER